ncbi:MAG: L-threonylcarbamoyladenylate synthase, partial [Lachnospiraceae bacterium]|nr:L-threonylcarbamoyladenylate synthase [Lachnospiraceae bacterium]
KNKIDELEIMAAGQIIKDGGLVAFPTETVYGLGADALSEVGARKIYEAKGRPSDNPLIVHIADRSALEEIVVHMPAETEDLMERFWPGPLTMIFEKSEKVPYGTTGGLNTVAVRMPDDLIARALIIAGGGFIAAPSANTSGRPSPTTAQHVADDLSGKIEMIIDGGSVEIGLESTILDMTVKPPMILRPGAITKEMIEKVIGEITMDQTITNTQSMEHPKAPGMKYRHYAPKAQMIIVEGEMSVAVKAIKQIAFSQVRFGKQVGIIATNETADQYTTGIVKSIGARDNEQSIAKNLYRVLREFDEEMVDYIYSEAFAIKGIGYAVMNRLEKAAGHQIVQAIDIVKTQPFSKIIFVSYNDNSRGPMAAELLRHQELIQEYDIESRGLIALFPEPANPKTEAIMKSQKMTLCNHKAKKLEESDLKEDTLILAMDETVRWKIVTDFEYIKNVYSLGEYAEDTTKIPSVYGQSLAEYGELYEKIKILIEKLANKINDETKKHEKR